MKNYSNRDYILHRDSIYLAAKRTRPFWFSKSFWVFCRCVQLSRLHKKKENIICVVYIHRHNFFYLHDLPHRVVWIQTVGLRCKCYRWTLSRWTGGCQNHWRRRCSCMWWETRLSAVPPCRRERCRWPTHWLLTDK